MNIDLHFHSRYSDGQFWPVDLAKRLGKAGVTIAALTDHDTFAGVPAFLDAAEREGIKGVAATEIDFCDPDFGFTSELLGYFPAGAYTRVEALLRPFQENRRQIAQEAVKKGAVRWPDAGISFPGFLRYKTGPNPAPEAAPSFSMSKYDVFAYFKTVVSDLGGSAYRNFKADFFDSDTAFRRFPEKPTLKSCIEATRADGGFPVLAHPGLEFDWDASRMRSKANEYTDRLRQAKAAGLWGIEVHACKDQANAAEINSLVRELAHAAGLRLTFGSDFHSDTPHEYPSLGGDSDGFAREATSFVFADH
jgi:predicted metal-dependent phosphoesterase TrpH